MPNDYTITVARSARKELERLSTDMIGRVLGQIEQLAHEPRPVGCRKLQGGDTLWRIRIGQYRVIHQIFDDQRVVDIVAVRHRSQAYTLR